MMARAGRFRTVASLATLVLVALCVSPAPDAVGQDRTELAPKAMEGVGLAPVLGVDLPLDAEFRDSRDRLVTLGDFFDGEKPVILVLVYFRCPMLCGLVLNGMLDGLRDLKWTPGQEFEIVAISFDPLELPSLARQKKQGLIAEYGRPESANGWHVLTGKKKDIQAVTSRLGFHYRWNEDTKEYMHPLVVFFCSPDGKLTHYSGGIQFEASELRRALSEAADGEIGNWGERFLQWCGHVLDADNPGVMIMKVGAILTLLVLVAFLLVVRARSRSRRTAVAAVGDAQL